MFSCVNEVFVYFNSSIEEEKVRCQSLESKLSRVGSLPLSLTRTRLNSRSVSPLLLSSALSAETARLDFGTFGTRFCYIGTWNIKALFKSIGVLNSAGRFSLSLSLSSASFSSESSQIALRFRRRRGILFRPRVSLSRQPRSTDPMGASVFAECLLSWQFLCRQPKEVAVNKMQERIWFNRLCFSNGTTLFIITVRLLRAFLLSVAASRSRSTRNTPRLCGVRYTREWLRRCCNPKVERFRRYWR